jgi:hypothetical protein
VELSIARDPRFERAEIGRFDETELDDGIVAVVLDLGDDRTLP